MLVWRFPITNSMGSLAGHRAAKSECFFKLFFFFSFFLVHFLLIFTELISFSKLHACAMITFTFPTDTADVILIWMLWLYSKHYWTVLITGTGDTVTIANKFVCCSWFRIDGLCCADKPFICFDQTSGRSPKLGGAGPSPNVEVH